MTKINFDLTSNAVKRLLLDAVRCPLGSVQCTVQQDSPKGTDTLKISVNSVRGITGLLKVTDNQGFKKNTNLAIYDDGLIESTEK